MKKIETQIEGFNHLAIDLDISYKQTNKTKKPLIIFCHGFKGFKDWGAWNLVAEEFAQNDFIFLKFNFSHNGTSIENKLDFENLEAFSKNNYSKELFDLECVLDYVHSKEFEIEKDSLDLNKIYLIGHSRGGGAVLVKAYEDNRVKKVVGWASIDSYNRFGTEQQIKKWKKDGAHIFINGRTGQEMPIGYQFYEDYIENINRLNIKKTVSRLNKPLLVVHGTNDPAVDFESAENIVSWARNAKLLKVENANHVFDTKHPYEAKDLPKNMEIVVKETIEFMLAQ